VARVELIIGVLVLALAEGNRVQHLLGIFAELACNVFDVLDGVDTRGEDEVDGSRVVRIVVDGLQNLLRVARRVTVDKFVAVGHNLADVVIESCRCAVRAQSTHHQELLERHLFEFLPVEGQLFTFRSQLIVPVFKALSGTMLDMLCELFEKLNLNEFLD